MAAVRFDIHDAWLIWAIPVSEEGTDLCGLIGTADAVNHAIPTREQVVRTINRGLRAGLLEVGGGRFRLHPRARGEIAGAVSASRTWFKQWDAVHAYLTSREWPPIGTARYGLPEQRYAQAVEEYIQYIRSL